MSEDGSPGEDNPFANAGIADGLELDAEGRVRSAVSGAGAVPGSDRKEAEPIDVRSSRPTWPLEVSRNERGAVPLDFCV